MRQVAYVVWLVGVEMALNLDFRAQDPLTLLSCYERSGMGRVRWLSGRGACCCARQSELDP